MPDVPGGRPRNAGAQRAHHARLLQRRESGKELRPLRAAGELGVVEHVHLGAEHHLLHADADLAAHGGRDALGVAREHAHRDPRRGEALDGLGRARLGRVEKGQVAHQHHVTLVVHAEGADRARVGLLRHGDGAQAALAQLGRAPQDPGAQRVVERHHAAARLHVRARGEHLLHGTLGDHLRLPRPVRDDHAHATALEVEGHLVDLAVAGVDVGELGTPLGELPHALDDGLVDEVGEARLEVAHEVGVAQHPVVDLAVHVEVALQDHAVLGERARLVAAQHVHRAQVLDRGHALDDDLVARHDAGAPGQARGHDHGQHLRRDAHRHRHREEQRVEPVPLGEPVDEKDHGAHDQHERHEHPRDRGHARIEARPGGPAAAGDGHAPHVGVVAGRDHDRPGGAGHHGGAREDHVVAVRDGERTALGGGAGPRALLDALALAGECGLVDEEVLGLDHARVGRDEVAGGQAHDVADHELGERDLAPGLARALDAARAGHETTQGLGSGHPAVLLDKAQDARDDHHHGDHHAGRRVLLARRGEKDVGVERYRGERHEDERERAREARREAQGRGGATRDRGLVGTVLCEARGGTDGVEPALGAAECGEQLRDGRGGGVLDARAELAGAGTSLRAVVGARAHAARLGNNGCEVLEVQHPDTSQYLRFRLVEGDARGRAARSRPAPRGARRRACSVVWGLGRVPGDA